MFFCRGRFHIVPHDEVMFILHLKENPSPFMVGDGALDVPSIEIRFTLYLVHFTAGASPRPTIINIVLRNRKREISHKNKKRPENSGRKISAVPPDFARITDTAHVP